MGAVQRLLHSVEFWAAVALMSVGRVTSQLAPGSAAEQLVGLLFIGLLGWVVYRAIKGC